MRSQEYTLIRRGLLCGMALCLIACLRFVFSPGVSAQYASRADSFGGGYSSLSSQQKRLVDDWFQRFSEVGKKPVDPAEGYDKCRCRPERHSMQ